jgi:hypothetical protein
MTTAEMNVTNLVDNFVAQITAQGETLSAALAEMDIRHKVERSGLADQLIVIQRTLAGLKGKPSIQKSDAPSGTRKPMSEAGRLNIANALKARRERLAAEATGKPAETVAIPASAPEAQGNTVQITPEAEVSPKRAKAVKKEADAKA